MMENNMAKQYVMARKPRKTMAKLMKVA